MALVREERHHSGPLPAPEDLAAYGRVMMDAPDRIVGMAEREAAHRQSRDMWLVRSKAIQPLLGTISGLVIGITTILSGAAVAMSGHDLAGFAVVVAGLVGLVAVFVTGKLTDPARKKDSGDRSVQ